MKLECKVKKIFLHIGQHKTASTAIQAFLSVNKNIISERDILYPHSLRIGSGHHKLYNLLKAIYLNNKQLDDVDLRSLMDEIETTNSQNIIISSEFFSSLNTMMYNREETLGILRVFKRLMSNYQIFVIVYMRRQDDAIESRINQSIKSLFLNTDQTLNGFIERKTNLFYEQFMNDLLEVFSPENIIARLYDKNIIGDFLSIFDLEDKGFKKIPNVNESLSQKRLDFLLITNKILSRGKSILLRKHLKNIKQDSAVRAHILSSNERLEIWKKYEESNRIFLEKYFNGLEIDSFFPKPEILKTPIDKSSIKNEADNYLELLYILLNDQKKETGV